jgi:PAS domain S-box-containing protein
MKATDESMHEYKAKNEKMFRNILAACPVGPCQVEDRKFGWVNNATVKMFGYHCAEDFVGKSTKIIYPSEKEYERAGATLYEILLSVTEYEADAKLVRKDGSAFDAHIRISAPDPSNLIKGTIVAITDRTPIRQAETERARAPIACGVQ